MPLLETLRDRAATVATGFKMGDCGIHEVLEALTEYTDMYDPDARDDDDGSPADIFVSCMGVHPVPQTLLRWGVANVPRLDRDAVTCILGCMFHDGDFRPTVDLDALLPEKNFLEAVWRHTASQIAEGRPCHEFVYDVFDKCIMLPVGTYASWTPEAISALAALKYLVNTEDDLRSGFITDEDDIPPRVLSALRQLHWDPGFARRHQWL